MDPAMVDTGIKVIKELGFPIFVAVWMLIRDVRIIRKFTAAIEALTAAVKEGKHL